MSAACGCCLSEPCPLGSKLAAGLFMYEIKLVHDTRLRRDLRPGLAHGKAPRLRGRAECTITARLGAIAGHVADADKSTVQQCLKGKCELAQPCVRRPMEELAVIFPAANGGARFLLPRGAAERWAT